MKLLGLPAWVWMVGAAAVAVLWSLTRSSSPAIASRAPKIVSPAFAPDFLPGLAGDTGGYGIGTR